MIFPLSLLGGNKFVFDINCLPLKLNSGWTGLFFFDEMTFKVEKAEAGLVTWLELSDLNGFLGEGAAWEVNCREM